MVEKNTDSLAHTTWECKYHVVFAPKFRRQIIYGRLKTEIGKILRTLCERKGIEMLEGNLCPDHVSIPPRWCSLTVRDGAREPAKWCRQPARNGARGPRRWCIGPRALFVCL